MNYISLKIIKFKINLIGYWYENIEIDTLLGNSQYLDYEIDAELNKKIIETY